MEVISKTTCQTKELACQLSKKLKAGDVLAMYGDLGTGKTTFTKYLVEALGLAVRVQSPTFVISRKYSKETGSINLQENNIDVVNHVDLYRIQTTKELEELDLKDLFEEKNAITVIEWPEIAKGILPANTICIYFESVDEDSKKITLGGKDVQSNY